MFKFVFKAEKEFRLDIEKFVRKSDNIEIEDDEVLADLIENDKGLWLVALTEDDDFGIINEKLYFLKILYNNLFFKNLTINLQK